MAQIIVKVLGGGAPTEHHAETLGQLRNTLGYGAEYRAAINGTPSGDDTRLADGQLVTFSKSVKVG